MKLPTASKLTNAPKGPPKLPSYTRRRPDDFVAPVYTVGPHGGMGQLVQVTKLTWEQQFARDWWTGYEFRTHNPRTGPMKGQNYWETEVRNPENQWMIDEAISEFEKETGRRVRQEHQAK